MGCLLIVECVILGFSWKYADPNKLEEMVSTTYSALLDGAASTKEYGQSAQAGTVAVLNFFQVRIFVRDFSRSINPQRRASRPFGSSPSGPNDDRDS